MAPPAGREELCSRCGAILPPPPAGSDRGGRGTCPECGLGYAWVPLIASRGPRRPEPRRPRRSPRARARLRARHGPTGSDERARAVHACDFPLYGLDASFEGRRWVGGHGKRNGVVSEIELAHGDVFVDGAPLVRVRTARPEPALSPEGAAGEAARELSALLWHEGGAEGGAEHGTVRAAFVDDDPLQSWDTVVVDVSGEPVPFRRLAAGPTWVAVGHVGDQLITLFGRHEPFERLRLVRITDAGAYLADDGGPR